MIRLPRPLHAFRGEHGAPAISGPSRVLPFGVFLGVCVLAGCTFEPRDGTDESTSDMAEDAGMQSDGAVVDVSSGAALRTAEIFRSAVATGDLSRALALVDRDATLVDGLVGEAAEAATRGELLLELRRRHSEGMDLEVVSSTVDLLSGEVALVVSRLALLEVGSDGIGEEVGRVHETILLTLQAEGWRIVRLHRSLAPPD